jgi:hypothetical protein
MATSRFGFTPFGLRFSKAPAAAGGWTTTRRPERTRSRAAFVACALLAAGAVGSVTAVRTVPWFGPLVADTLRAVIGSENVTGLEEAVAGVEDRVEQLRSEGKARTLSDATPEGLHLAATERATTTEQDAVNRPADVAPPHAKVAAPGDGVWQAVELRAGAPAALHRTMLHPDPERAYAELFVFALDLSKLRVHAEAGSIEPKSPEGRSGLARPGIVPERERPALVAAFNGGFKAEHGHFGMMVDGRELLAPKPLSCTIASRADGELRIGTWRALESERDGLSWWRQTPGCMVEAGVLHPGLRSADTKNWGATIDGKTVIRRSAAGLSADGRTLYVGISNSTTARALALGMQQAGAVTVAQLDVNFSFPRFLVYEEAGETGNLKAIGAVKGLLYTPDEYLGHSSSRDFFYVTARTAR